MNSDNRRTWRKKASAQLVKLFPDRKHGILFEDYVISEFERLVPGWRIDDTHWAYATLINDPGMALDDKSLSAIDDCFGDLDLIDLGVVQAQLSLKSVKLGSTLTLTDDHMKWFPVAGKRRWFCYATVDGQGQPMSDVLFLPAEDMLEAWNVHREQQSGSKPYIRMKFIARHPNRIIGIENFLHYLKK